MESKPRFVYTEHKRPAAFLFLTTLVNMGSVASVASAPTVKPINAPFASAQYGERPNHPSDWRVYGPLSLGRSTQELARSMYQSKVTRRH